MTVYDREKFAADLAAHGLPLTASTLDKLSLYADMLVDWQERMNLVGPATLPHLWQRHMLDSAQLLLAPEADRSRTWLDIGSGAGFPGLVLALLGVGTIHLVEATRKKFHFLRAVAEATGVTQQVHLYNGRIENLSPISTDVITARACAPLDRLLAWGHRFACGSTCWLLLKGEHVATELEAARLKWTFHVEQRPSLSDSRGVVLKLTRTTPKK